MIPLFLDTISWRYKSEEEKLKLYTELAEEKLILHQRIADIDNWLARHPSGPFVKYSLLSAEQSRILTFIVNEIEPTMHNIARHVSEEAKAYV